MSPRLVVLIALAMVVALLAAQPRLDGDGEPEETLTIDPGAVEEPAAPPDDPAPQPDDDPAPQLDLGRGGLPFPEPRMVILKLGRGGLPFPEVTATLASSVATGPETTTPSAPAPVLVSVPSPAPAPPSKPDPPPEPDPPAARGVVPTQDDDDGGYDDDDGFDDDDGSNSGGSGSGDD
jgi:hypothetical protein